MAQDHPILTPAILFVSKLFSQAEFYVQKKGTHQKKYDHPALRLLKNPNPYQTGTDFLETLMFIMIAKGRVIIYKRKQLGVPGVNGLFILNEDLIKWPDGFADKQRIKASNEKIGNLQVVYDEEGENVTMKISELIFMYDLPNCVGKDKFETKSRIDGLKQTLINTHDSLTAKNIILKSNGKEMITGEKDGFPLTPDEKSDAERLFNVNYGLSPNRKRGIITKASLTWKSLHIALRDLGLDESVKVDGNIIYTALHIPKDILSLEAKKTTYNNFKESMVSYLQNEMQANLVSLTNAFVSLVEEDGWELKGDYEHLPIMQYILIERYEGVAKRALALKTLRESGLPDKIALELCGFEDNITLNPLIQPKNEEGSESTESEPKRLKVVGS